MGMAAFELNVARGRRIFDPRQSRGPPIGRTSLTFKIRLR